MCVSVCFFSLFVYLELEEVLNDRSRQCDWYFYHAELLRQADDAWIKKDNKMGGIPQRLDGYPAPRGAWSLLDQLANEEE
jgi:hypothetical protein